MAEIDQIFIPEEEDVCFDDEIVLDFSELSDEEESTPQTAFEEFVLYGNLSERMRKIAVLFFGFSEAGRLSVEEIMAKYGMTEAQVRQLLEHAVRRYDRFKARSKKLRDFLV